MLFYQYKLEQGKIPLRVKIGLICSIIFGLIFLALFAFTFFLVALAAGVVLFFFSLFRKPPASTLYYQKDVSTRPHRPSPRHDDDVIDI